MKNIGLFFAIFFPVAATPCTNFIVTKGASADGSVMITYSADSHVRYGELYFRPAADYPAGAMVSIFDRGTAKPLGQIPQVAHTYQVVGFMNEFQVAIGETTFDGRYELQDTTGILDYGSLMMLAMQRSKSAREAIKTIALLVEQYGYYSTGESFSISDANEAWIMEIIGKGTKVEWNKKTGKPENVNKGAVWVAVRIPDGYISAHANQARITRFTLENKQTSFSSKNLAKIFEPEVEVVYAADVISFARQAGYFKGEDKDFSFSDIYAPMSFSAARFCEIRVWSFFRQYTAGMEVYTDYVSGKSLLNRMPLYVKLDKKISQADLMAAKRDHLEGTEFDMTKDAGAGAFGLPYRWRPLTWELEGKTYFNERATATQQTGFSFIAQSRGWMPNAIGGVFWFGVDDAATTVYVPMYCGITSVPQTYAEGNGDMLTYSENSAFWVFNKVANFCYLRYNLMTPDVLKLQKQLESKNQKEMLETDAKALEIYPSDPDGAKKIITGFSLATANQVVESWEGLFRFLLVKFLDGNVKKEQDGKFLRNPYNFPENPDFPGYPEQWKRILQEKTGDTFLNPQGH